MSILIFKAKLERENNEYKGIQLVGKNYLDNEETYEAVLRGLNCGAEALKWRNHKAENNIILPSCKYATQEVNIVYNEELPMESGCYEILMIYDDSLEDDVKDELSLLDKNEVYASRDVFITLSNLWDTFDSSDSVYGRAQDDMLVIAAKKESGIIAELLKTFLNYDLAIIRGDEATTIILTSINNI